MFPWIGARPVGQVTAPELLTVLRRIEARARLETVHRAHQNCGQVFRYIEPQRMPRYHLPAEGWALAPAGNTPDWRQRGHVDVKNS